MDGCFPVTSACIQNKRELPLWTVCPDCFSRSISRSASPDL